jgi:predicted dehydrogenase
MKRTVSFGYIGAGPRGQRDLKEGMIMEGCRIVALCDPYQDLLQEAMAIVGDPQVKSYTDYRDLLKDPEVEAVMIAVEPENNAHLVCEALEAGKHVQCEVPLAFSLEECWRIVLTVEKTGLKFQMAEQARYFPFIQTWAKMARQGDFGKFLFAEGEYLHGMTEDRYWQDSETGKRLSLAQAKDNPKAKKSRLWEMNHPILYLPHELSPILHVLDDRVSKVSCMATRKQSYKYDWFPQSDIELAIMQTEKDVLLRMAAGFTVQTIARTSTGCHWYRFMGTEGSFETNRSNSDRMKLWLANSHMADPAEAMWAYSAYDTPPEALASGHGGTDYYPTAHFIQSILDDKTPPMDVYLAVETAAPAIMAVKSLEQGGACLTVPDFRPGPLRRKGEQPTPDILHAKR